MPVRLFDQLMMIGQFLKMPLKGGSASSDGKGRAWQEHLFAQVRRMYPGHSFRVASSQELMGLFICVLVNSCVSDLVREVSAATIKTGLGGLHANKVILILMIDQLGWSSSENDCSRQQFMFCQCSFGSPSARSAS
jgi:hypothetical protein